MKLLFLLWMNLVFGQFVLSVVGLGSCGRKIMRQAYGSSLKIWGINSHRGIHINCLSLIEYSCVYLRNLEIQRFIGEIGHWCWESLIHSWAEVHSAMQQRSQKLKVVGSVPKGRYSLRVKIQTEKTWVAFGQYKSAKFYLKGQVLK